MRRTRLVTAVFALAAAAAACTVDVNDADGVDVDAAVEADAAFALGGACAPHGAGVMEEDHGCVTLGGPTNTLRAESGGSAAGRVSTGTTTRSAAVNFARYDLNLRDAGTYRLRVFVGGGGLGAERARYVISHNGKTDAVTLDQRGEGRFVDLGTFDFARGSGQAVVVGDNTGVRGQRLVFDALAVDAVNVVATPCPTVRVASDGADVNVRPTASTSRAPLTTVADRTELLRLETVRGQAVRGVSDWHKVRTSRGTVGFISGSLSVCVEPAPTEPTDPTGPTDPTDPTGPTDPTEPDGVDLARVLTTAGAGAAFAADAATVLARARAEGLVDDDLPIFTAIDFSLPSNQKRLWTVNVATGAVLVHDRVSHGSGSNSSSSAARASRFSNTPGSRMSSLGLTRTAETYQGSNGYSLRLDGLESSNDNVRERAIVVHGAAYAEDSFVNQNGYLGRSSGCPAVAMSRSRSFIDVIKGGSLLWMWYPDAAWRTASPYLR
jgi:hypothetical protein